MSNEMISVPRDDLEFALGFKCHGHKNRTDQEADRQYATDKLRALLAKPAEQSALQQVGVVVVNNGISTCYTGIMFAQAILDGTIKDGDKLYVLKESE